MPDIGIMWFLLSWAFCMSQDLSRRSCTSFRHAYVGDAGCVTGGAGGVDGAADFGHTDYAPRVVKVELEQAVSHGRGMSVIVLASKTHLQGPHVHCLNIVAF